MEEKNSKKSYYLPGKLMDAFADWCKPGRDYSPKIAGLILAGMAMDNPGLLEQLCKLAHSDDIKKAKSKAKKAIIEALLEEKILDALAHLSPDEKAKVLSDIMSDTK